MKKSIKEWFSEWDEDKINFTELTADHDDENKIKEADEGTHTVKVVKEIRQRELKHAGKIYPVLAALLCIVIIAFMFITVSGLPKFGQADNPTNNEVVERYVEKGMEETGAVNVVAGVILDYRAFDTLGESHVLFTAVIAVFMLLLTDKEDKEPIEEAKILKQDNVLRNTALFVVPLAVLFGIYVILNGHLGPGGGFSGGAIIGAALIVYAMAFGFTGIEKFLTLKTFRIIVLCALLFYSGAKCYSFFCGANELHSIFGPGTPGMILSSGLILPLNIAVGIVVACTMYGFYSIFKRGRI